MASRISSSLPHAAGDTASRITRVDIGHELARAAAGIAGVRIRGAIWSVQRSEEHTSELVTDQSRMPSSA